MAAATSRLDLPGNVPRHRPKSRIEREILRGRDDGNSLGLGIKSSEIPATRGTNPCATATRLIPIDRKAGRRFFDLLSPLLLLLVNVFLEFSKYHDAMRVRRKVLSNVPARIEKSINN